MTKEHCWINLRSLAASAGLVGLAAGSALAQTQSQVTVAVRGGYESFDRAASLDKAATIGLDAMYGVNKWLSIGPVLSLGRPQSTGKDFVTALTYGVLNLGDTTSFYYVTQPVTLIDGGLNVRVQLPGAKLSPYATGGIGGYAMFLDVQQNRGEKHKTGLGFNIGAGLLYSLSDRAGITFDVRSTTFTDYDRSVLDARNSPTNSSASALVGRIENTVYQEEFATPPKSKSTVTNFTFSFGFSYVPISFFGGGGR